MKLPNWLTAKTDGKKKNRGKKILFPALIASVLLFLASTHFANAQSAAISYVLGNIGYYVIGKIAFGVSFIIAWIGGVAIGVAAWLVSVMLGINNGIFQSAIVQTGFSVTLALANLGFVFGIIVIAIATILKRESYGIKKLLLKLIAAAILVNFSLVIMAPIFQFSNNVTQYFLNCIDTTDGGCTQGGNGLSSMNQFASRLAGSFNPQTGFSFASSTTATTLSSGSTANGAFAAVGGSVGQMLVPIFSIGFVALESLAVVIVLAALVFMLLVRYIYIAVLAILMPFAWLCWVFPNLSSNWDKWWKEFIRWTLFAPIVVFFLYLAMLALSAMSKAGAIGYQSFATYTSPSNSGLSIWGSLSSFFTSAFTPIIQNALNMMIMLGLSVAGLVVANSMSITGAKAGLGAAKGAGKAFGTYVGKATARGAVRPRATPWTPLGRAWRGTRVGQGLFKARTAAANSKMLKTQPAWGPTVAPGSGRLKKAGAATAGFAGGLMKTTLQGAATGSGLFKNLGVKNWECQNCAIAIPPQLPPKQIQYKTKPTIGCPQCGATAAMAKWKQV